MNTVKILNNLSVNLHNLKGRRGVVFLEARLQTAIAYLNRRLERDTLKVWRAYVPTHMFIHSARYGFVNAPVRQVIAHPPGTHTKSPIVNSMTAVQIITSEGERWIGVDNAYIDGSLRMVCERVYNTDKVLARWERVGDQERECLCKRCGTDIQEDETPYCLTCEEYLQQDDPGALYAD